MATATSIDFADYDDGIGDDPIKPKTTNDQPGIEILPDGEYNFLIEKASAVPMKPNAERPNGGFFISCKLSVIPDDPKAQAAQSIKHVFVYVKKGEREDMEKLFGFFVLLGFTDPNEWRKKEGGMGVWMPLAVKALSGIVFRGTKKTGGAKKGKDGAESGEHWQNLYIKKRLADHEQDKRDESIGCDELELAGAEFDSDVPF